VESVLSTGAYIVVDIGKTLSKVTLWSKDGQMLDRRVRPNGVVSEGGVRRLDAAGIGQWLITALAAHRGEHIEAIIPVGHGAGIAALVNDALAFAPYDYEQAIPEDILAAYLADRDDFSRTGSPALPDGLNIGSQLAFMDVREAKTMASATLLPWAQYWAWFLSGRAASEVTSLGCHSDLWNPVTSSFSDVAKRRGWDARFAPLAKASDVIGTLRPELVAETGLPAATKVLAGLHDSNAALLAARGFPEIARHEATVLSTGTWFIAMRLPLTPDAAPSLPEARDCLVNVDVYGQPVPSARFMGGREIESVIEIDTRRVDIKPDQATLLAVIPDILSAGSMLLPTLAPGCGPFAFRKAEWIARPEDWFQQRAAACLYAALVTETALDLIGTQGRLLVEGRFAEAEVFVRALARLRPDLQVYTANAHNDVSFGALRLVDPTLAPRAELTRVQPLNCDLTHYRASWLHHLETNA